MDVLADVQFGPVGERKDADALSLVPAAVIEPPELGTLVLGIPVMLSRTERENALLRSRFLFVTTGAAERRVEAVLVDRLLQGLRLHDVGVDRRAMDEGIDVPFQSLGVNVHDEIEPQLLRHAIAKLVHFAEFPGGIDVQ